jgi:hypothetical protein
MKPENSVALEKWRLGHVGIGVVTDALDELYHRSYMSATQHNQPNGHLTKKAWGEKQ